MDLLNYFTVCIFRPEAILTSYIADLFKSLNEVLAWATPDLDKLNFTAMNAWSAANHEQKWPYRSHFHPSPGRQTPRYPLSNCPRGQILHWSDMNQAERAEQPLSDRDWESAAGADRDTDHTAWHADSQSTYRNIRSWQIGLGGREGREGAGGGRRTGSLTAHVKFIVSLGLRGNTSPLRDVSEK